MLEFFGKPLNFEAVKKDMITAMDAHLKELKKERNRYLISRNLDKVTGCYICGSKYFTKVMTIYGINYVQCNKCFHVFTDRRLKNRLLNSFYKRTTHYVKIYKDKSLVGFKLRVKEIALPKVKFAYGVYEKYCTSQHTNLKWLDIGSGGGHVLYAAREIGFDGVGIETNKALCEFSVKKLKLNVLNIAFENFAQSNKTKYDVISFLGMLEHIINPLEYVKLALRILSKDGILLINVPNYESFSSKIQSLFPKLVMRHADPLSHIQLFTTDSLKKLASIVKCNILAFWYFGMDFYELLNILSLLDKKVASISLYKSLRENTNYFQYIFDKSCKSDSLIAVFKKAS